MATKRAVLLHLDEVRACRRCPNMVPPSIVGRPVHDARVMLVGQAPGSREGAHGRPFAYTAGTTLFQWMQAALGVTEEQFRSRVWFSAVCRCFPGKKATGGSKRAGGDRVPSEDEMERCAPFLAREISLLRPALVLAVGKLAISRFVPVKRLDEVVGQVIPLQRHGATFDLLPLPHPSGASTWHRSEPGKGLLGAALSALGGHPAAASVQVTSAQQTQRRPTAQATGKAPIR